MKKITINKKKSHILLITLLATTLMLAGCGNQNSETVVNENSSENVVEVTATPTDDSYENGKNSTTAEPTEEPMIEVERETIELSADEYYVDYPLSLDENDVEHSGRQVYIKKVPSFEFYPEENLTTYSERQHLITTTTEKGISLAYAMDSDYSEINSLIGMEGWEVSEPEKCDNGLIIYRADWYDGNGTGTLYTLYYPLDDDSAIAFSSVIGSVMKDYISAEEVFLNFYRTAENSFVVVDPETTDVIISN